MGTRLIAGGLHSDARGSMRFCNAFDLSPIKRFYTITNSVAEPKRGWIMHHMETKWFFPLRGVTTIHVESSKHEKSVQAFLLNAAEPAVLCVPPNNWFLIEQDGDAEVQIFSNCVPGEFKDDDFRREVTE